jgi:hypothetical protein
MGGRSAAHSDELGGHYWRRPRLWGRNSVLGKSERRQIQAQIVRMILKWILVEQGGRFWGGLICLNIGTSDWLL